MPKIKELHFDCGLMCPTLTGKKKITLRKYRRGAHDFLKDEIVLGTFKDGLNILLRITADTEIKLFSEMTEQEAQEDGFENAAAAFNGLKNFYPDLRKKDLLATVRFEILSFNGIPAVSANEHF